ncbi:ATPase family associated with various cellular activities [Rhodovulum sulfidophilum]|uniref:ATPase family associated with various cellular activities n=1 Tax=Rhodovulum sulfidophilum TaxID=35806 RepID=A0A0D6AYT2_RHOSU|nr:ATPase family associated with various cellular activities [Rhodovulum sulfidophilum]
MLSKRLGGLQIRVHRFDSGTRLHLTSITYVTPFSVAALPFTGAFTVNGGVKTGHVAAQNPARFGVLGAMARALTE